MVRVPEESLPSEKGWVLVACYKLFLRWEELRMATHERLVFLYTADAEFFL